MSIRPEAGSNNLCETGHLSKPLQANQAGGGGTAFARSDLRGGLALCGLAKGGSLCSLLCFSIRRNAFRSVYTKIEQEEFAKARISGAEPRPQAGERAIHARRVCVDEAQDRARGLAGIVFGSDAPVASDPVQVQAIGGTYVFVFQAVTTPSSRRSFHRTQ